MSEALLQLRNLQVSFPVRQGIMLPGRKPLWVHAVDRVSLEVQRGEILALVGESGCGKTTMGRAMLRLVEPAGGQIIYNGADLAMLPKSGLRHLRQKMQMIYQDPYEALDARQSVFDAIAEPLIIHNQAGSKTALHERVMAALESAGLHPAEEIARRYPHHLSGGQRQRVAIAAAMALEPELIVADEPVSMLDVSIRAEILKLMLALRQNRNLTYVFITHDLSLAWVIADRIAVLYLGKLVEIGPAAQVIQSPQHPYTRALVSVIPSPSRPAGQKQLILSGETPSPVQVPTGCRFHPRCWLYQQLGQPERCLSEQPELAALPATDGDEGHLAACHFIEKSD
jgi:oligopeptide/dipeptide ABC transporter ATP-binding protein